MRPVARWMSGGKVVLQISQPDDSWGLEECTPPWVFEPAFDWTKIPDSGIVAVGHSVISGVGFLCDQPKGGVSPNSPWLEGTSEIELAIDAVHGAAGEGKNSD